MCDSWCHGEILNKNINIVINIVFMPQFLTFLLRQILQTDGKGANRVESQVLDLKCSLYI